MIKIDNNGKIRDQYVKREALKMLILGPLFSIIYIVLSFISMSKWPDFFYVIALFLLLMMIFFFIVAPIIMLNRHNRTIKEIRFEDNEIKFKSFQALWMKAKFVKANKKDFKITSSKFYWYGKEKKDGYVLKLGQKQEYYIVLDYFTNKEQIISSIGQVMV